MPGLFLFFLFFLFLFDIAGKAFYILDHFRRDVVRIAEQGEQNVGVQDRVWSWSIIVHTGVCHEGIPFRLSKQIIERHIEVCSDSG